jgi:hypothetical protein
VSAQSPDYLGLVSAHRRNHLITSDLCRRTGAIT